jgi:endo-1,3(4)-beta-glucanase
VHRVALFIVTKQGSVDSNADSGFGIYNDHADHLGYFLYGIAVLTKIDTAWGEKYKSEAYALIKDFMNLNSGPDSDDTRLRHYDLYHGHNQSPGLIQYKD